MLRGAPWNASTTSCRAAGSLVGTERSGLGEVIPVTVTEPEERPD
jgi:hypothetical protein